MIERYKQQRLERGYMFQAEFTVSILGEEKNINSRWHIPLDLESRIDLLGLIERARNGESITYTFDRNKDVVFEPSEFLKHANEALKLYSKVHHISKEAQSLKGKELSEKIKELVVC